MMFASFHSNGTTPSFNDKLNTLASGIGDGLQSSLYYHSTMRECGLGYLSMSPGDIPSTLPHKDASHPVDSEPLVGREKILRNYHTLHEEGSHYINTWEDMAASRGGEEAEEKGEADVSTPAHLPSTRNLLPHCNKNRNSRIGLLSHTRTHDQPLADVTLVSRDRC